MRALLGSVALATLLLAGPAQVAAAAATLPEPLFGAASGEIDEPGSLTPLGYGRFGIQGRVYTGRSIGRSVRDGLAACFTGSVAASEEWALQAPSMSGAHRSSVTIRGERWLVALQLRGDMEALTASGTWEIIRATGPCATLEGAGRYTATFSHLSPEYRLTFDGLVRDHARP